MIGYGAPMTLPDLIARLEQATEGSAELDLEIARLTLRIREYYADVPLYSRSIDAALQLVPDRCAWAVSFPWRDKREARAWVDHSPGLYADSEAGLHYGGVSATSPALALVIAAFKARNTKE